MNDPTQIGARPSEPGNGGNVTDSVLVARRDEPLRPEHTGLGNVVPFARPRRNAAAAAFALATIAAQHRPAPAPAGPGAVRRIAVLAASLLLHGGLLTMFWQSPAPVASIGSEVISIEVTLGATTAAGLATAPGELEAQVAAQAEDQKPDDTVAEKAAVATVMPQDVPVAPQETAPEAKEQKPETPTAEQQQQQQQIQTQTEPVPEIKTAVTADERKRVDAPTQKDIATKKQSAAAAPSDVASGVGRGRSDVSANYNGTVATHLARHKQYPVAARKAGAQGVATVSFSLDGGGRVVAVQLASGSGVPVIDQEAVAMVRRASPFPAPPDGRARNFTVPVRFNIR
jgi:TonB family protein